MSLPKPYYEDTRAGITIYCGNCLDILPALGNGFSILSDPPYGMKNNTDSRRFSGGKPENDKRRGNKGGRFREMIVGDDRPFDPTPFLAYENVILWGSNHFSQRLPVGSQLVWIKRTDRAFGTFLSDAEVAWEKGGYGVYCFRDFSMKAEERDRKHPNQKPIPLMRWCISRLVTGKILDPFCGSGSTLVAAKDLGRKAIGIEISEEYCRIAVKRLQQENLPLSFDSIVKSNAVDRDLSLPLIEGSL